MSIEVVSIEFPIYKPSTQTPVVRKVSQRIVSTSIDPFRIVWNVLVKVLAYNAEQQRLFHREPVANRESTFKNRYEYSKTAHCKRAGIMRGTTFYIKSRGETTLIITYGLQMYSRDLLAIIIRRCVSSVYL